MYEKKKTLYNMWKNPLEISQIKSNIEHCSMHLEISNTKYLIFFSLIMHILVLLCVAVCILSLALLMILCNIHRKFGME